MQKSSFEVNLDIVNQHAQNRIREQENKKQIAKERAREVNLIYIFK